MRRRHRLLCALLAAGLPAAAPPELDLDRLARVSDAELSDQRGGFAWEGMEIRLGADIRTYLDGDLALQTLVNWDSSGGTTQQFVSGALTPAGADELRAGILSTGSITMRVGDASVFLANQGQTALVHRDDGPVQNILVNTASNTSARQEMDVELDLSGYEQFGAAAVEARIVSQVQGMIADATLAGLRR